MARPGSLRRIASAALVMVLTWSASADLHAKSSTELRYSRHQIFSGALRYLRIDLGYEVTEKDDEAAYLLFRYIPLGKNDLTFGAIEIIEREQSIQLTIKLPEMPSYHEAMMRDGLVKKLREEYGAEPERSRRPKDEPAPEEEPKEPAEEEPKAPKSKDDPEGQE